MQRPKTIAAETGLTHRAVADGERMTGIYRRNVQIASGRFAMLDDGMGFMPGAVEAGGGTAAWAAGIGHRAEVIGHLGAGSATWTAGVWLF